MKNARIRRTLEHVPHLARAIAVARREGGIAGLRHLADQAVRYPRWIARNRLSPADRERIRRQIAAWEHPPRISIVMPVHDIAPVWMVRAVESVRRQFYPHWQLCIADDASRRPQVRRLLAAYRRRDPRVRVVFLPENRGISGASNAALEMADGRFVGFLDHDDELSPDALYEVVRRLTLRPDIDLLYSDEDKLDRFGRRCDPFFKPDWSPEMLSSCMYTCHFSVYRRSILRRVGGLRTGFEGVQDYDLALRFTETTPRVAHLPRVLYHWRKVRGSLSSSTRNKSYAFGRARRALTDALGRRGRDGRVEDGLWTGSFRLRYAIDREPRISVLIPIAQDLRWASSCLRRLLNAGRCRPLEALLVFPSGEPAAGDVAARLAERYEPAISCAVPDGSGVAAAWNRAAAAARGAVLVFLAPDCLLAEAGSLEAMLEHAQREPIGAVGARVTFDRDRIHHCGLVLGLGAHGLVAFHSHGFPASDPGYFGRNLLVHNVSAVGGGVMMMRRDRFERVGGFDPQLDGMLADADLGLKLRRAGYRNVYTPYARFHRAAAPRVPGAAGRPPADQRRRFRRRWARVLENGDPYYNPNLTRERLDFSPRP